MTLSKTYLNKRPFIMAAVAFSIFVIVVEALIYFNLELKLQERYLNHFILLVSLSLVFTALATTIIVSIFKKLFYQPLQDSYRYAKSFENIIDKTLNEIYIFDKETLKFTYVNSGAMENNGYSKEELINMKPWDLKPNFEEKHFKVYLKPLYEKKIEQLIFETYHQRKDGTIYNVDVRVQLMPYDNKEQFVAFINDITKRKKAMQERELYYKKATRDHLTKIYNRQMFDELFQEEFYNSIRHKRALSLVILDIDNFKMINDTYGHDVGDTVLKHLSSNVLKTLRKSDVFARWGGEEFVILMKQCNLKNAHIKAEEMREIISNFEIPKVGKITCSFGVSTLTDYEDSCKIFKDADEALYKAKKEGKNMVR